MQALEQNPFVTEIHLELEGVRTTDWGGLLHVIAARENLVHVKMTGAFSAEERRSPAARALVRAFLRSIQQNNSIRAVRLEFLLLPADVSTFVDTASAIILFSLWKCDFAPTERERGTRDLAAALQRSTNIKHLKLSFWGEIYAIPILQALQSTISLKDLEITWGENANFSNAGFSAIQQLLESSTSITRFVLCGYTNFSGETFRPVAQGLIQSQSVCDVTFTVCHFRDEESTAQFRSILQEKRNLASLCLESCSFSGQVHDATISALSRTNSALRTLQFLGSGFEVMFPNDGFKNLLRTMEKGTLERFAIGEILTQPQLQTLAQSIPSMRMKELEVRFDARVDRETAKREISQAVQSNFSLRSLTAKVLGFWADTDLFDDDHNKKRLEFYADRNEQLDQWVDNPETVAQKVWPEALKLAERAGPDSLFRGLRSVLGSDCVKSHAVRKHKRTQLYAPS